MAKKSSVWMHVCVAARAPFWRCALAGVLAFGCTNALAADGDPDPTFGFSGRAYIPWERGVPDAEDSVAVLSQPDGKVILVANVNVYSGFDDQDGNPINTNCIGVTRELADGQMDPSFGANGTGYFLIDNDPRADHDIHAYAATLDIHGRIVIAGHDYDGTVGRQSTAIWAVKSDGSMLDASFGSNGEYVHDRGVDFSTDAVLAIYAAKVEDIQAGTMEGNGFLISGFINNNDPANQAYVAIISPTGTFVGERAWTSFEGGATCSTWAQGMDFRTLPSSNYYFYVAATKACGSKRTVQVGSLYIHLGPGFLFPLTEFSFGVDGITAPSAALSVAIDDAGRAVVGGYVYSPDLVTPKNMGVARVMNLDVLDATFDGGGAKTIDWGASEYTWINAVRIQNDGKIMLGGNEMLQLPGMPAQSSFALVRLNHDGTADTGFGNRFGVDGASDYAFPLHGSASPMPRVAAMTFTEGENVLLGGYVQDPAALQNTYFAAMRIRNGPVVIDDTIFRSGFDY